MATFTGCRWIFNLHRPVAPGPGGFVSPEGPDDYEPPSPSPDESEPWRGPRARSFSWLFVTFVSWCFEPMIVCLPRSGELRTQKLKSHLVRTQNLHVLPLKPGVGQDIAIHAMLAARDFFLAYFHPSGPFSCIFPNLSQFLLCWLWLTRGSCIGPQNKIDHPAGCRFPCFSARGM